MTEVQRFPTQISKHLMLIIKGKKNGKAIPLTGRGGT
jgi:hypothetical protein